MRSGHLVIPKFDNWNGNDCSWRAKNCLPGYIWWEEGRENTTKFFPAGFVGLENIMCNRAVIDKINYKPTFPTVLLLCTSHDEELLEVKQYVEATDWFTLWTFHLPAPMAGISFSSTYDSTIDEDLIHKLCMSWLSRNCSTVAMVIRGKKWSNFVEGVEQVQPSYKSFWVWSMHGGITQLQPSMAMKELWHQLI